jgi:hypothetical protein
MSGAIKSGTPHLWGNCYRGIAYTPHRWGSQPLFDNSIAPNMGPFLEDSPHAKRALISANIEQQQKVAAFATYTSSAMRVQR